ncbi:MAG: hypothetical protein QOD29_3642 [Alphaproteobacteria bacterium]|nr:hypothetical protein [Alphaproteobacteria bacterium]
MTTKKPTRRPRHAYSPELTDLICERLLDGTSLRQICQDKNMPARSAIIVWLAKHKEFARKYMIARHIQIDCLLGDMLDIADDCSKDWIEREGPDGKKFRVFDHENFRRSKRQMGALQWRISKLTGADGYWPEPATGQGETGHPRRHFFGIATIAAWEVPSDCR